MNKLSKLLKDTLILRIIIAIGLIVMTLLPLFSEPLITVMLSFSLLFSGIDILFYAYNNMLKGEIFNQYSLIISSAILLFIFKYKIESIITIIVFQICLIISDIIIQNYIHKVQSKLIESEYSSISSLYEKLDDNSSNTLTIEYEMKKTCNSVFLISICLAILFAILMPFIKHLTVYASVKRAVCILLISNPYTMTMSYKIISVAALSDSAINGIILSNINSLENIQNITTVILDDNLNYNNKRREVIYSHSSCMDTDSFLNFIFHVVYYSDQDFSKIIKNNLKYSYKNGLVFSHLDIPNYGIKCTVNGMRVIFGNDILCNKFGIDVSNEINDSIEGDYYFLCIANKCVGCLVINEQSIVNSEEIINSFNQYNKKCIFYSDIDEQNLTKKPKLSIFYPESIENCKNYLNYIINDDIKTYDSCIIPDFTDNIALIPHYSNRVVEIARHNSFISFGVKILIIIISILGFCTPWLALLIDFGSAFIIMINSKNLFGKDIINSLMSLLSSFKK